MQLNTYDRLVLLNILPKQGDYTTLKIIRKLREELSFDEAEHAALQFKQTGTQVMWQNDADKEKEIVIGKKANEIIANTFKQLSDGKLLEEAHVRLYERFVVEPSIGEDE